jgi:hypothetical protein
MKKTITTKLYLFTLIATVIIFVAALFISNYVTRQKTNEIKADEDKITVDMLSLEDQADLITSASSCSMATTTTSELDGEFQNLESRLTYMQGQLGETDPDVFRLKRYYSLLEVKDYLLQEQMNKQCNGTTVSILYFYSSKNCAECTTEQYMLQAIEDQYPNVRVYSFDYALDLPEVETLITLKNIPKSPPVTDINGTIFTSFQSFADMKAAVDAAIASSTAPFTATSTATTTAKTLK